MADDTTRLNTAPRRTGIPRDAGSSHAPKAAGPSRAPARESERAYRSRYPSGGTSDAQQSRRPRPLISNEWVSAYRSGASGSRPPADRQRGASPSARRPSDTGRADGPRMRTPGVQAPKSRPRVQTTAPGKAVRPSTRPIIDGKDLKPRDAKPALSRPAPVRKPHITRSTGVTMGAVLALLVALAVGFMLFRDNSPKLTQVVVYGGAGYTDAEIASMAGLRIGMPMSAVSLDSVRSAFSVNSAVRLESAAFTGEQGVELTVSRRSAKAAVNSAGIVLVIDEDGVILDRMNAMPEGGLVLIRGMDVTISASGKRVEPTKPWQQSAMLDLLTALEEGGVIGSVEEMNLLDRFNIYLFTRSGIQVIIGEATEVDIKVLWMKTVLEDLQKKGVTSGLIDVSTGKNAIYAER